MRFERKYRIEDINLSVIQQIVKGHPASFRKTYPDRQVNNIYLDTPGKQCYIDNQMGIAQRRKFRIRWYGVDKNIKYPNLEIKIRDNNLGTKESYALPAFQLGQHENIIKQVNQILQQKTPLQPTLLNTYHRSYWEAYNRKIRLTIDSQLHFQGINTINSFSNTIQDEVVIVELKYPSDLEIWAIDMMQYLPFRMTKNSKYVNGILLTNNF